MNWVAVPLTLLRYDRALLLYTLLSAAGLLAASALVLLRGGERRAIIYAYVVGAQAALYFLTPIGVTHLERGQFDVLVATASVLAVGCVFSSRPAFGLAVVAGFLGALKWTSAAFLGPFALLGFILASGARRWAFLLIPLCMAVGTFPFWNELKEYWLTIRIYEINATPYGLTLQHFIPRGFARAVPISATLLVASLALYRAKSAPQRDALLVNVSAPFSAALMNAAVCFGTLSFEFHTVATLSALPAMALWVERAAGVARSIKILFSITLALFLVLAFRTYPLGSSVSPEAMTAAYVVFGLLFLSVSVFIVNAQPHPGSTGSSA